VQQFKAERADDEAARAVGRRRLVDNAGVKGVDAEGLQLDRREFAATKKALNWLAECHGGWYQREDRPNAYRSDLLTVVADFSMQGLPAEHGIVMRVRKDGQAWYAYRRTPSGYIFGIGAVGTPLAEWYHAGFEPPTGYPGSARGWVNERPQEWKAEAET
jgi:hypothetical protein